MRTVSDPQPPKPRPPRALLVVLAVVGLFAALVAPASAMTHDRALPAGGSMTHNRDVSLGGSMTHNQVSAMTHDLDRGGSMTHNQVQAGGSMTHNMTHNRYSTMTHNRALTTAVTWRAVKYECRAQPNYAEGRIYRLASSPAYPVIRLEFVSGRTARDVVTLRPDDVLYGGESTYFVARGTWHRQYPAFGCIVKVASR